MQVLAEAAKLKSTKKRKVKEIKKELKEKKKTLITPEERAEIKEAKFLKKQLKAMVLQQQGASYQTKYVTVATQPQLDKIKRAKSLRSKLDSKERKLKKEMKHRKQKILTPDQESLLQAAKELRGRLKEQASMRYLMPSLGMGGYGGYGH
eukprot:TRINITY_DN1400_c0_g1_i9.p1 TRINITY_DN1400_c0_g1~~TRINITY_DN1400_c0_g1_i9.p1  ORF type:complete len:150 (-),score=48.22 TRINITY_DN1400_c0_g1_i9:292-741(-)